MQQIETQLAGGKIVRSEDPLNLEMPFEKLDSFITPTELGSRAPKLQPCSLIYKAG